VKRKVSQTKRGSYQSRSSRVHANKSKSKSNLNSFKRTINSVVVWFLVAINVVLISSLVHRLVTPYEEPPISGETILTDALEVEVLNGCGVRGIANTFADYLRSEKFDVVKIDNADNFDYEKSLVIDRGTRDRREIKELCKRLGIPMERILLIDSDRYPCDATFILGADYQSLKAYQKIS
jgi:hypothetical protein